MLREGQAGPAGLGQLAASTGRWWYPVQIIHITAENEQKCAENLKKWAEIAQKWPELIKNDEFVQNDHIIWWKLIKINQ